jgi:hypothetical protein
MIDVVLSVSKVLREKSYLNKSSFFCIVSDTEFLETVNWVSL